MNPSSFDVMLINQLPMRAVDAFVSPLLLVHQFFFHKTYRKSSRQIKKFEHATLDAGSADFLTFLSGSVPMMDTRTDRKYMFFPLLSFRVHVHGKKLAKNGQSTGRSIERAFWVPFLNIKSLWTINIANHTMIFSRLAHTQQNRPHKTTEGIGWFLLLFSFQPAYVVRSSWRQADSRTKRKHRPWTEMTKLIALVVVDTGNGGQLLQITWTEVGGQCERKTVGGQAIIWLCSCLEQIHLHQNMSEMRAHTHAHKWTCVWCVCGWWWCS